jgi:hypothetical protein
LQQLLLAGMACLFPIALYCLYLAMLHNRRSPTVISGPWDFAGVLMALSGFLLIGGTILIFSLHTAARDYWLRGGGFGDFRRTHSQVDALTITVWGIYAIALIGGSAWLIVSRANFTSVYNVTPAEMEMIVENLCGRLGLSFAKRGARFLVGHERAALDTATADGSSRLSGTIRKATFEVDGSASLRQVSLRWLFTSPESRRDLEAELVRDLNQFDSSAGTVSGWFITAGGAVMIVMIFGLVTFLLFPRR